LQAAEDGCERVLQRGPAGQVDHDAADRTRNPSADLQQLQPDRADLGIGQFRSGQPWRKRVTSSLRIARLCLAPSMFAGRRYAAKSCRPQVTYGGVECVNQADLAIHLPQQRQAAITGQVSTPKIGDDLTAVNTGEQHRLAVTLCHSDGLSVWC